MIKYHSCKYLHYTGVFNIVENSFIFYGNHFKNIYKAIDYLNTLNKTIELE